ncbi:MAG: hypothetical protein HY273_07140 [Gammaproteobacteria bacterium]|nr:hypothetical protein [Gammaproteobacteria bacterium]
MLFALIAAAQQQNTFDTSRLLTRRKYATSLDDRHADQSAGVNAKG